MANRWTDEEIAFIRANYPESGKAFCAGELGRSVTAIRAMVSKLGLKLKQDSDFFKSFQLRAAASKVGKKRPDQSELMKKMWAEGKLKAHPSPFKKPQDPCPICGGKKYRYAKSCQKCIWKTRHHPRGATGHRHTEKAKKGISEGNKKAWKDPNAKRNSEENKQRRSDAMKARKAAEPASRSPYSRGHQGTREDLGIYVRSKWEANYARVLELLVSTGEIYRWQYEADTFDFPIKRGIRSYTPDFKVWDHEDATPYYIEIKGWMDPKSKTKLARMARYYPDIRVDLVQEKEMRALKKQVSGLIPNWE